jgi:sugar diacid utilization regulator
VREGDAVDNEALLLRLADLLSLHLSFVQRRAASAVVGGVAYAIVPVPADPAAGRRMARQTAEGFLSRVPDGLRPDVAVGIGGQAETLAAVSRSRQAADQVLRLLRQPRAGEGIADIEDRKMQVLLLELSDLAGEEPLVDGPLALLTDHDQRHHTQYVATLRAYLESFGDVPVAARTVHVHQNTFRYRLQRLQETPGLDLADADQRLSLLLQLRLLELRGHVS